MIRYDSFTLYVSDNYTIMGLSTKMPQGEILSTKEHTIKGAIYTY